jgi:protein ImuA
MNKSAQLAILRRQVAALEGGRAGKVRCSFGVADIDRRLGGGLLRGALHEVVAGDAGAATGFCLALVARLARRSQGSVLWCEHPALDTGRLYAPGLARFGIDPGRLIVARVRKDAEAFWTLEEGLHCAGLAAVVGEVRAMPLAASRRLQLAAEASGVTALVLRPNTARPMPSAAMTRWRVSASPDSRWRGELLRCRGGDAHEWMMECANATSDFAVAAPVRHRPDLPRANRACG